VNPSSVIVFSRASVFACLSRSFQRSGLIRELDPIVPRPALLMQFHDSLHVASQPPCVARRTHPVYGSPHPLPVWYGCGILSANHTHLFSHVLPHLAWQVWSTRFTAWNALRLMSLSLVDCCFMVKSPAHAATNPHTHTSPFPRLEAGLAFRQAITKARIAASRRIFANNKNWREPVAQLFQFCPKIAYL